MQAWFESMVPGYGTALMWTIFALIGLLILLVLIRIVRGLTFGTFVAGGRNRKARLAVMDATAVDSHRRLVLVRRDDVEHLILIGGPTDVVVEQNIRLLASTRRPAAEEHLGDLPRQPQTKPAAPHQPAPAAAPPAPRPQPQQPANQSPQQPANQSPPPRPAPAPAPATPPHVAAAPVVAAAAQPPRQQQPYTPPPAAPSPAPVVAVQTQRPVAPPAAAKPDLDEALLEELEVTLDKGHRPAPPASQAAAERSLDEEMSRLLGDLAAPKR